MFKELCDMLFICLEVKTNLQLYAMCVHNLKEGITQTKNGRRNQITITEGGQKQ